jgi:hypothetical protein
MCHVRCCINVIWDHCCIFGHSCTNVIPGHCCTAVCSNSVKNMTDRWQAYMGRPIRCSLLRLEHVNTSVLVVIISQHWIIANKARPLPSLVLHFVVQDKLFYFKATALPLEWSTASHLCEIVILSALFMIGLYCTQVFVCNGWNEECLMGRLHCLPLYI